MADLRPYPTPGDEHGSTSDRVSATRTRRWGKMVGKIIIVVLVVAPIVAHLILIVLRGGPGGLHTP